jgi:RNA polymerase sigma-70 factor (ECF subfamily)
MAAADSAQTRVSLLQGMRDHKSIAWQRFWDQYTPMIARWCRLDGKGTLQDADVHDITGNVLLTLTREMNRFLYDPHKSFRAWLRTIVHNEVCDFFHKAGRPGQRGVGGFDGWEVADRLPSPDGAEEELRQLEAEMDGYRQLLRQAQEAVKPTVEARRWEAFRLTALERQKGKDVAVRLGMTVAAVYQARCQVLKKIKDEVDRLQGSTTVPQ